VNGTRRARAPTVAVAILGSCFRFSERIRGYPGHRDGRTRHHSAGSRIGVRLRARRRDAAGLPPITVPVAPTVALPNKTVKIYACTGAG
jgi:hypothetical protein